MGSSKELLWCYWRCWRSRLTEDFWVGLLDLQVSKKLSFGENWLKWGSPNQMEFRPLMNIDNWLHHITSSKSTYNKHCSALQQSWINMKQFGPNAEHSKTSFKTGGKVCCHNSPGDLSTMLAITVDASSNTRPLVLKIIEEKNAKMRFSYLTWIDKLVFLSRLMKQTLHDQLETLRVVATIPL